MTYRISGLSPEPFRHLFGLSESELSEQGAKRYIADESPFPDRIELRDADPGEALLLVNYAHQPADTPYRSSHAIFVLEGAEQAVEIHNRVPEVMRRRPLSLRAFDGDHMMMDADLVGGAEAEALIERLFANPEVAYIQAHSAKRGCYAARIDRA